MDEGGASYLDQFLILAKNAKGKAAIALIQQVLNHKKTFVFGELLETETIQGLKGTEDAKHLDLLALFAYGTYPEYVANSASLPDVSAKQLKKLKQLTIVSLAKQSKVVSYKVLQENLDISNLRELEDLVIESIYAGLLRGKLDQRAEHLEVKYAISRDIKDEDLDEMMQKLTDWDGSTAEVLSSIEHKMSFAKEQYQSEIDKKRTQAQKVDEAKKTLKASGDVECGQGGPMDAEYYDEVGDNRRGGRGTGKRRMQHYRGK